MGHTYTKSVPLANHKFKLKCALHFYFPDLTTLFYSHTDLLSPPNPIMLNIVMILANLKQEMRHQLTISFF